MYLVTIPIPRSHAAQLVFCMTDPRAEGYVGPLETGTELESPDLCDSSWRAACTSRVVGQAADSPKRFRLFESIAHCHADGFNLIGPMPVVAYRWNDELRQVVARKAG